MSIRVVERNKGLFRILTFLVVILIVAATAICCVGKKGFFLDELYSYGLSNSSYAPFVSYIKDGSINNTEYTQQELMAYLTVQEDEKFDYGSVYYNQTKDVHPPLFYFMLHTVSSLFPDVFSKWLGLSIGIIFFALTLAVLFLLVKALTLSRFASLLAVALYGLSQIGLSDMLMIRMYMPLTFFTVLFAYLLVLICKDGIADSSEKATILSQKASNWLFVICGLVVFLGMLTQYYFIFFSFFAFVCAIVFLLFQKQRKKAFTLFVGCALGFMVFLLFWSSFFNHLFADKLVSGTSAVESLFSFGRYPEQVGIFVGQLFVGEPIAFVLIIIAFVGWFIGCILLRRSLSIVAKRRVSLVAFVIALPVALSIVVVAVISPVNAVRYVYNIAPFISCLAAVAVVYVVRLWAGKYTTEQVRDFSGAGLSTISFTSAYSDKIDDEMQSRTIVLVLSVVIIVSLIATAICTAKVTPSYTHREFPQFDAKIEPYLDSPCLYVNDGYSAPITTDILQLAQFQNVFVSNLEDMSLVADYVDTHAASDQLVVYMTINDFWTKAYDPSEVVSKLKEQFGYTEAVKLYRFGLSESYVLTK